jgi:hypothetical protein
MGGQQSTIRPGAGSCSCCDIDVHAYDATMLRHLMSQLGGSQIMLGTFAFCDHSPVA